MPTVESAWETFVKQKCSEAIEKALEIYDQIMEPLSSRLPCDNEDILKSHGEAQRNSIDGFEKETTELISAMIVKALGQLTVRNFLPFNPSSTIWSLLCISVHTPVSCNLRIKLTTAYRVELWVGLPTIYKHMGSYHRKIVLVGNKILIKIQQ